MRRLALLLGATAPAAAATLSAFFLGLAAGSAALGRRTANWSRPLRAYAVLQLGIAAGALLVEPILRLFGGFYPSMYSLFIVFPGMFFAGKLILAAAAIFIPSFLMGGTLPTLAQAIPSCDRGLGVRVSGLYALNTCGATLGALSVPFLLLPSLGADWGYLAATGGSLALGLTAWLLDTAPFRRDVPVARKVLLDRIAARGAKLSRSLASLAFFSGFLLLALEVFWARMFALIHENSIYSFSMVVAVFLGGLAAGAALARAFLRRGYSPRTGLGFAWIGSGVLVLLSPRLFLYLSSGMEYLSNGGTSAWSGFRVLLIAAPVMLPAVVIAGAIMPLLMELSDGAGAPAGPAVGRLLAINSLGSIVGPLMACLFLGSNLRLWWCIALVGGSLTIAMECTSLSLFARRPLHRFAACLFLALGAWFLSPSQPLARISRDRGERLVSLREGSYGAVAVLEDGEHRWMTIDNHYVLGGTSSTRDERMQAHLPLFLHPAPGRVALLGLGTGITAGAALLHPVNSMVALEIVPEVVRAAKDDFADSNLHVLEDQRVEIRTEDARNFLKGSGRKFDVIIGDLIVPWRPGESSLLSLEHFRATRDALLPGGIFCQWLPLFQLSEEGFRIVAATFLQVYPGSMLWRGDFIADQPAIALIGQRDPAPIDVSAVDRRVADLSGSLKDANPYLADPAGLWLFLIGQLDSGNPKYLDAKYNQDSRPRLELLTPEADPGQSVGGPAATRLLTALSAEMRTHPLEGRLFQQFDADHRRWRGAGERLWEASILSTEGRDWEAREKALEALRSLPAALQRAVLGREVQGLDARPLPAH